MRPMVTIPMSEMEFSYVRSSGPGGQNVNKVNSKAQLHWNIRQSPSIPDEVRARFIETFGARISDEGTVLVTSDRHRDQPRNREDCIEKLHEMLRQVWTPPRKRKKTKATRGSQRRRLDSKKRHGEKKAARRGDY
jgi:ribosome-associated protein